jgi:hypothetical protein
VAETFDLKELDLFNELGDAAWSFFDARGWTFSPMTEDEIDLEAKLLYDFYLDVGKAVAEVFQGWELHSVNMRTSIWEAIGPWVTSQINGVENVPTAYIPKYHTAETRLVSNEGEDTNGMGM